MGNCGGKPGDVAPPATAAPRRASAAAVSAPGDHNRRFQIYEPAVNQEDIDLSKLLKDKKLEKDTKAVIEQALSRFFGEENAKTRLRLVFSAVEREEIAADKYIINEGEPGDKLYIIEKGELEITINQKLVRTMARGDMVGELALLYDAPRSATVRTMTEVVAWTLSREHFKSVQVVSTSAVQLQREKWLIGSTDLASLSRIELSRLIGVMQHQKFSDGQEIFVEGLPTDQVVLIESGRARVTTHEKVSLMDPAEKDKHLSILRPKFHRKSVQDLDASEFAIQFRQLTEENGVDAGSIAVELASNDYEVSTGCLLGIDGLRAKAGLETAGAWSLDAKTKSTLSPYTVTAVDDVHVLSFSHKVFENMFGINAFNSGKRITLSQKVERGLRKFEASKFKMKHVLGSGSFGVVIYAESREDSTGKTHYALKVLSKVDVLATGQLRHVTDERRLLAQMESPFILKLYGTYQTPHQIVFVTEAITNGDMWSVIYEPPFYNKSGLPPKLILFYSASIVMALSHIHSKGMAYRDLKPENIMIDSKGYIRLIDFGFAKTIPYTKVDEATGETKVYAKSYTLCGTPEYLAPEFVFNLGHDHSADLWALGVMIYEMYMTATPFAPKRVDNITELFNNIAVTKTNGVRLPPKLEERSKGKVAGDIVLHLLKPEQSERMGVQEGYTSVILEHEFFNDLDVEGLVNGTLKPVHIPSPPQSNAPISSLPPIKAFRGDQSLFEFF